MLGVPGSTAPTSSFAAYFLSNGKVIEYLDSGVTFKPTPGQIIAATVSAQQTLVGLTNTAFNFGFQLTDPIGRANSPVIQIDLPD